VITVLASNRKGEASDPELWIQAVFVDLCDGWDQFLPVGSDL
jgi:hypothetical protein